MMNNTKRIEALEASVNEINANIATLTSAVQKLVDASQPAKTSGKKSSTKKQTTSKTSTKSKKADGEFDRALYESTAKKLGCFYNGVVCATVKDGKVIYTRQQNRQRVYEAMGYKK